ncbi:MAG: tyrosine-type recombinase/integrase [Polyangiaceae bacterium]|nr:tyrosine-type recombinase/integrase [Polyangiaceae bacterium]
MCALLDAFREDLAQTRAPRTARSYAGVAAAFLAQPDAPLDPGAVERFLRRPRADGDRRSASTWNHELAALRALAAFAVRTGAWPSDPTTSFTFQKSPRRSPSVLSVGEVRQFFEAPVRARSGLQSARDIALLAVLASLGLRVHELVALDVDQVDFASATLIGVKGKGATIHDLPLNTPTVALLREWLAVRANVVGPDQSALFVSNRSTRLSVRTVQYLFARWRAAIGTAKRVTPHTLRHSLATNLLGAGVDLATTADVLRHSDVNVTRKFYLHLVDERRRAAVERLSAMIPGPVSHVETPARAPLLGVPRDKPANDNTSPGPANPAKSWSSGTAGPAADESPCVHRPLGEAA